jgi:hypothetical protein
MVQSTSSELGIEEVAYMGSVVGYVGERSIGYWGYAVPCSTLWLRRRIRIKEAQKRIVNPSHLLRKLERGLLLR